MQLDKLPLLHSNELPSSSLLLKGFQSFLCAIIFYAGLTGKSTSVLSLSLPSIYGI